MTSVLTVWLVTNYLFRKEFQPVDLSKREAEVLNAKLSRLDGLVDDAGSSPHEDGMFPGRRTAEVTLH